MENMSYTSLARYLELEEESHQVNRYVVVYRYIYNME